MPNPALQPQSYTRNVEAANRDGGDALLDRAEAMDAADHCVVRLDQVVRIKRRDARLKQREAAAAVKHGEHINVSQRLTYDAYRLLERADYFQGVATKLRASIAERDAGRAERVAC